MSESDAAARVRQMLEEIVDALRRRRRSRCPRTAMAWTGTWTARTRAADRPHGQTIDAVQHLALAIVFPGAREPQARRDRRGRLPRAPRGLLREADDAAEEALRVPAPGRARPDDAAERRVVHEYLRDRDDVETHSEGEEPERHLVVSPPYASARASVSRETLAGRFT